MRIHTTTGHSGTPIRIIRTSTIAMNTDLTWRLIRAALSAIPVWSVTISSNEFGVVSLCVTFSGINIVCHRNLLHRSRHVNQPPYRQPR